MYKHRNENLTKWWVTKLTRESLESFGLLRSHRWASEFVLSFPVYELPSPISVSSSALASLWYSRRSSSSFSMVRHWTHTCKCHTISSNNNIIISDNKSLQQQLTSQLASINKLCCCRGTAWCILSLITTKWPLSSHKVPGTCVIR